MERPKMIWILAMIIGVGYAVYSINKFADNVNPYDFTSRK